MINLFQNRADASPLFHLLLEANFKSLVLEGKSPAEIKTKLGIKKDLISDEDFKVLLDMATDRKTVVAMVQYYTEVKDIDIIKSYLTKFLSKKIENFKFEKYPTFKGFTDYLDSLDNNVTKGELSSFSLESHPADFQTKDGQYKVYSAKGKQECIKYGKGYTFCISDTGSGNLYNHYRFGQGSKYYFVFDMSLPTTDNKYITVVDAHPNNKFEFTHANNDTPKTSAEYNFSLDKFLATKPGLAELKGAFKPMPLSDIEKAKYEKYKAFSQDRHYTDIFASLEIHELIEYIEMGFTLPSEVALANPKTLPAYVNNGGILGVYDLKKLQPQILKRYIALKYVRELEHLLDEYHHTEDDFKHIVGLLSANPSAIPNDLFEPIKDNPYGKSYNILAYTFIYFSKDIETGLRYFTSQPFDALVSATLEMGDTFGELKISEMRPIIESLFSYPGVADAIFSDDAKIKQLFHRYNNNGLLSNDLVLGVIDNKIGNLPIVDGLLSPRALMVLNNIPTFNDYFRRYLRGKMTYPMAKQILDYVLSSVNLSTWQYTRPMGTFIENMGPHLNQYVGDSKDLGWLLFMYHPMLFASKYEITSKIHADPHKLREHIKGLIMNRYGSARIKQLRDDIVHYYERFIFQPSCTKGMLEKRFLDLQAIAREVKDERGY
jgi:hypothetical protein